MAAEGEADCRRLSCRVHLPGWCSESLMSAQKQYDDREKQLGPSRGRDPVMTSSVGPFDRVMASVVSLRVEVLGRQSLGGMEGVLCGCQLSYFSSCRHPITDQSNQRKEGVLWLTV